MCLLRWYIGRVYYYNVNNVIFSGNIGINELLTMLIHAVDVFTEIQETESKEEEERAAREKIKSEQDRAYQASLQLDR